VARVRQNVSQAVFMRTAGLPAQLLIAAVPAAKRIAVLWNSGMDLPGRNPDGSI
jgi:hypothetical protein